jgi:hypothetical protein
MNIDVSVYTGLVWLRSPLSLIAEQKQQKSKSGAGWREKIKTSQK